MRTELSSLDLYFLVKEFQEIINAKIDKVFQRNNFLQFQIHVPNKGKKYLTIILPSLIYLSNNKETIENSDKFALSLRKHLKNTRIRELQQKEFERIIQLKLEAENKILFLYIELFKPGNLILCNNDNKIIMALKYKGFGKAVNITLGLPIIRTSVDHGTAFELAGSGKAKMGSFITAINTAIQMSEKNTTDK